ncbi:Rad9-domain-containing protein [Pavlovales sp. CCMP2436]|nr:Rad9-domain-containing protein [Pavlovales sp. CCMP2436]
MGDSSPQQVEGWTCTISTHMRLLGKVLAALDKIGRDLFIEAGPDRLLLRTLNPAQSVFCMCTLPATLFDIYEVGHEPPNVKIFLKLLAPLFRSTTAQRITLQLMNHGTSSYVRVIMHCTSGLVKTFDLSYEEALPVNAMYNTDTAHRICSEPRLLLDCVNNLPSGEHEMMFVISNSELHIKNDVDDSLAESAVRTEMSILPQDLHEFSIGALASSAPLRISFSTKEFKAVLQFAEGCSTPISAHFDEGGRPLILVAAAGDGPGSERVRLECVIATVVDQSAAADEMFGGADDFGMGFEHQTAPETNQATHGPSHTPMELEQESEPGERTPPQSAAAGRAAQQPHGMGDEYAEQPMPSADASRVPGRAAPHAHYQRAPPTSGDPVGTDTPAPTHERAPTHEHPGRSQPQQQLNRPPGSDNISNFPSARQLAPSVLTAPSNGQGSAALVGGGAESARNGQPPTLQPTYAGSDTDNDEDAVGATPPDSPPSKRVQTGFVEQFALPMGP